MLYLTFDDGPANSTREVLAKLAAFNAKATFFVIGSQALEYPDTIAEITSAGHGLGNHTWNHKDLTVLATDDVASQLTRTAEVANTGACMRPPYGAIDAKSGAVSEQLNLQPIMWTAQAYDWKSTATPAQIARDLKAQTAPGSVLLLHDGGGQRTATLQALDELLPYWAQQGYELRAIEACVA